jgi:enamine deaminase RidA (YjgF/YER057c/UK114 family)
MTAILPIHPETPLPEYNMPFLPAVATAGGKILWVSGCGPIPLYHKHPHVPAEEASWLSGSFRDQFDRTMENVKKVLAAGGGTLESVVKMTVRESPPPRTLIGVASLSHQDMLIEIDVTAVV